MKRIFITDFINYALAKSKVFNMYIRGGVYALATCILEEEYMLSQHVYWRRSICFRNMYIGGGVYALATCILEEEYMLWQIGTKNRVFLNIYS